MFVIKQFDSFVRAFAPTKVTVQLTDCIEDAATWTQQGRAFKFLDKYADGYGLDSSLAKVIHVEALPVEDDFDTVEDDHDDDYLSRLGVL